jgi:hypothetical protein
MPQPRSRVPARRKRPHRADVDHAEEDRRAHGAQRAHLAARVLGLRDQLRPGQRAAREEEGSSRRPARSSRSPAFIAKAAVDALRQFPTVNASIDGDNIVYKRDINLGIAVALDNGLIVPVIRNADEKNLLGLSRGINDLATRARSKKLNPDEVQGGTFTITNPGIFGALYGLPLINQPQVAILGVGTIEKRPVVIDDAIAIRPVCHLTLGYDHRLIDGAEAGRFLSFMKERLEGFEEGWTRRPPRPSARGRLGRMPTASSCRSGSSSSGRRTRSPTTAAAGASARHHPRRQDETRPLERAGHPRDAGAAGRPAVRDRAGRAT